MAIDNMVKSYQLEIFGDTYTLLSDESEQHVIKSAQMVDKYMKEIADKVTSTNLQRIAVLAAVRIASMLLYKERELEEQKFHEEEIIELIDRELSNNDVLL